MRSPLVPSSPGPYTRKEALRLGRKKIAVCLKLMSRASAPSRPLLTMKRLTAALAASDVSLDANSRTAMANDFTALRNQITKTIANASFNGTNLLKTGATALFSLADSTGTSKLTVAAQVMGIGNYGLHAGAQADLMLVEGETHVEAVVARRPRNLVIKRGQVVARDGQCLI